MSIANVASATKAQGHGYWAFVPVVLLVTSVAGVSTLATIAARDPGFALEKDYYQQAIHWDRQQAQWAENARLGYELGLDLVPSGNDLELVLHATDRGGAPLPEASMSVEAFASARAANRRMLTLVRATDGSFRAPLTAARPGLWEFRVVVLAGGRRYAETLRADVPGKVSP